MSDEYQKKFLTELWGCHKHMKLPMTEIYNMTVADRKFFIAQHNREVAAETERMRAKAASRKR